MPQHFKTLLFIAVVVLGCSITTVFAQPDTVRIRSITESGWVDGIITEKNLETGEQRTKQTEDGVATFIFSSVGILETIRLRASLFPNPMEDFAQLQLGDLNGEISIKVTNYLGQVLAILQPGDDHLSINSTQGIYFFHLTDDYGKSNTIKAVLTDGTAVIQIISSQWPVLKSTTSINTHSYTYHDPTGNYDSSGIQVNLLDPSDQTLVIFDIGPIIFTAKDIALMGRFVGGESAIFTLPSQRAITLEEGGIMPIQEWTEPFDNREDYPYELTVTGGPHSIPMEYIGSLIQNDTIELIDTINQEYTVQGQITPGASIRMFAFPDSTNQIAGEQVTTDNYQFNFPWKLLEREVLLKAEKDEETQRIMTTLLPGVNTYDFEFTPIERTMYFRGPTTRDAWITLSSGDTIIADSEGEVFDSITTTLSQITLDYYAPHSQSEQQVVDMFDGDTINLIMMNTQFGIFFDIDSEIEISLTGDDETIHGQGGDTLSFHVKENTLFVYARVAGEDLFMGDTGFFASPGILSLSWNYNWEYRLEIGNTMDGSSIIGSMGGEDLIATGNGGTVNWIIHLKDRITTLNITQTLDGYYPTNQDFSIGKGDNSITLATMIPTADPLETFYTSAGVITRNGTVVIKDGTQTIGTLSADGEGNVSGQTFDWQLQDGRDLTLEYVAPDADSESITKVDVDDGETIDISHLLNANFPLLVQADTVVEWEAVSSAGTHTGIAEEYFTFEARANDLSVDFTASATDAANHSSSKTFPVGGGSHTIPMEWIYRVALANTKDGSSITGSVGGENVFSATGNSGTVNSQFTRYLLTPDLTLRIQQNKANYTSSDQEFEIKEGDNSITLDELLGKYTLSVTNTVSGTTASWDLNGNFAGSASGSGSLTLYTELDADQATSDLLLTADGYLDWTDSRTIYPGTTSITANQQVVPPPTYTRDVTINLVSDESSEGHLVRDSEVTLTYPGGSETRTTSSQSTIFTITTTDENITVNYSVTVSGMGHVDKTGTFAVGGSNLTESVILSAIDFTGNVTYTIRDLSDLSPIEGAMVAADGKSGTTNSSGNVTLSGFVIDENSYSEPISTSITTTVSGTNITTITESHEIASWENYKTIDVVYTPPTYSHSITFNLVSSEAGEGHLVRDCDILFTYSGGTTTLSTSGQTVTFNWDSEQEIETVTYDVEVTGNGHQDIGSQQTTVGSSSTVNETLTANDWTGDVTYHVEDQDGTAVLGASVTTSQGKSGTTDGNGDITHSGYVIDENTYSEPVATTIAYTVSGDGFDDVSGSHDITEGSNEQSVVVQISATGQEYTITGRVISINGSDFISGSDVLKFVTGFGTYYATSSGGNFSVTITADPSEMVAISGNVSGYEDNFISVVGYDSQTGSGPATVDPDDLSSGSRDVILGRTDLVNAISHTLSDNGFYRGAFLQKTIWTYDEMAKEEIDQVTIDAFTTVMNNLDGIFMTSIFGKMINISSDIDIITGSANPGITNKMRIQKLTGLGYGHQSLPGMNGHGIIAEGTGIGSATIEGGEFAISEDESLFYDGTGTSTTEAGKARLVYTVKFGY